MVDWGSGDLDMPLIHFVEANGDAISVDVPLGETVMDGALSQGIGNILGVCGGACCCATCHCYVDAEWSEQIEPPSEEEQDGLDTVLDLRDNSRLSCQIVVTGALDGLVVYLPEFQY